MTTPAPKRSWLAPLLIGGGGLLTVGATIFAVKKSSKTVENVQKALAGADGPPVKAADGTIESGAGRVQLRLTHYYPFEQNLTDKQRKTEGKPVNAAGGSLFTVEDFLAGKSDYVSLAGDLQGHKGTIWPYGQKILVPWGDKTLVGRVTDTGGHFYGLGKVVRAAGFEPIDVCVFSKDNHPPKTLVTAQIIPGDTLDKAGRAVATSKLAQNVRLSGDDVIREGNTTDDYEALARMVESETGGRTLEEQHAAAWVARNRAADLGLTLHAMLAPNGKYGSPQQSGGYASTRRVPTDRARLVAAEVLDAWSWVDPTGGAVEFWMPEEQSKLHALGDVYRASSAGGDAGKMKNYARYADYGTEADVRAQHENDGLHVVGTVGSIELLGRMM